MNLQLLFGVTLIIFTLVISFFAMHALDIIERDRHLGNISFTISRRRENLVNSIWVALVAIGLILSGWMWN